MKTKKKKQNHYEAALSKKVNAALELNKLCHVFILMRAPYMQPTGFPTELVPVDQFIDRIKSEWSIVLRELSNGNNANGRT